MNIDSDMYRLVKSLVELAPNDIRDINKVAVESFYFRNRLKSNPFYYKFDQTITRLKRKKYIKVISKKENIDWLFPSVDKPVYLTYNIKYSVKTLKEYLRNRRGKKYPIAEDKEDKIEEPIETGKIPFCVEEKGKGYLKFSERGEKILIGRIDSRPYLFLKVMLESDYFGKELDVNVVMEKIYIKGDEDKRELNRDYGNTAYKVGIIKKSCIKQLQKGNKLRQKITFKFDKNETRVRAKLMPN